VLVLLIDDSDAIRLTVGALLEDLGHTVVEASSIAEGRRRLDEARFDVALVDLHLPDGLGTTLIAELRERQPEAARVLLSGSDVVEVLDGVDLVVTKGSAHDGLGALLERALAARRG
jgi:CheY-like chemotaxis protein